MNFAEAYETVITCFTLCVKIFGTMFIWDESDQPEKYTVICTLCARGYLSIVAAIKKGIAVPLSMFYIREEKQFNC